MALAAVLVGPVVLSALALVTGPEGHIATKPSETSLAVGDDRLPPDGAVALGFRPEEVAGLRFGVAVKGADPALVEEIETASGVPVGIVRVFARWDTAFPSPNHQALLDAGRTIHLSIRPRTDDGLVIPWAELATAEPGSPTHERLVAWVDAVASYGDQIYFTLNHEPETVDSRANGRPDEFVAAWRRTVELLRAAGGDEVRTVLVLGRGPYETGEVAQWYPGDDVVDVVGVDPYNWHRCQGTDRPWASARELLSAALDFAVERGKPLAIPEIASTEDLGDPNRKAAWILELAATVADPDIGPHLEFVAWFNVHDPSWPDCRWAIDSSPASASAFAHLLRAVSER